jgi:hypothetical protein
MSVRVFRDRGVDIPLSTVIAGGKSGVLAHLRQGLGVAELALENADENLTAAKAEMESAELHFARAEATAVAWRTAYDAAKQHLEA